MFISHIHEDRELAIAIKTHLEDCFLRAVQAFVSSHEEDVRIGDDWFVEIETRIREAGIVVLLLTPSSKGRPWIHFEAGASWVLNKPVIPVCANGLTFDDLPAPLNRRQAINLSSHGEFEKLLREIARRADLNVPQCDDRAIRELAAKRRESAAAGPPAGEGNQPASDSEQAGLVTEKEVEPLPVHLGSAVVFSWRLSDAFPGVRGVEEFVGEAAVDRLEVLLREPLTQETTDSKMGRYTFQPFWWFRGGATNAIEYFEGLGPDKILIFPEELKVRRVIAVRSFDIPERDFAYLEAEPESPIGLYDYEHRDFEAELEERFQHGYAYYITEEYALWKDRAITRREYDDNATVLDGRPVSASGAKLRVRHLTPYNIIIAGNAHVVNQNEFDRRTQAILDGILRGTHTVHKLVEYVGELPRPYKFDT